MIDEIDQTYLNGLSHSQKDALILALCGHIKELTARLEVVEAELAELKKDTPKKTSKNSSLPPSTDFKANIVEDGKGHVEDSLETGKVKARRKGVGRKLDPNPDEKVSFSCEFCPSCHSVLSLQDQKPHKVYDRIEIIVKTHVTRVQLHGGTCWHCGEEFLATPPEPLKQGSPFGASVGALALYMHYCNAVSYQRLTQMFDDVFQLKISEGALRNIFKRSETALQKQVAKIEEKILGSPFILSDETSARVNGKNFWQWVFIGQEAVLHVIKPSRGKKVVQDIFGDHQPDFWVSDLYCAQKGHGKIWQVCLAHQLRNLKFAIEAGDLIFAPRILRLLAQAIKIGRKRPRISDSALRGLRAALEKRLAEIMRLEPQTKDAIRLHKRYKAIADNLFVFITERSLPATNNRSEQALRFSVIFRKVTNGFRSEWGKDFFANIRSVIDTEKLRGLSSYKAIKTIAP